MCSLKKGTLMKQISTYLQLHFILMLYSISGVCSKIAAGYNFFSLPFIMLYGGMIAILAIYAVVWQQILKKMPLVTAYANKAATVVWAGIWGIIIFHEQISLGKVVSMILVAAGIILFSYADAQEEKEGDSK